ncbi:MAG TPA: signal recognition particle protein [Candidatus Azoamicus sp.]
MLKNLTSKFTNLIKNFIDKYKLTGTDLDNIIKKVRKILLDADVSLITVKYITSNIKSKLIGLEIDKKITPGQLIIKSIYEEFTNIMGGINFSKFKCDENNLNVILFVGLQGVGKTTNIAKFSYWLKKKYNKKILLISCDVHRAAAVEQLNTLAKLNNIDFLINNSDNVNNIIINSLDYAKLNGYDFLLVDSAGRLHLDESMTKELKNIVNLLKPSYIFLIIDGMYGQDALNSSFHFLNNLNISGFIVTKMDSDSKGGIILSLAYSTKKPIFFLGVGEKISDLEVFHPDRIASRLLGMGDLDTLLEEVKENFSIEKEKKIDYYDLNLFKEQINNLLKLGGLKKVIEKLPIHNISNIDSDKIDDENLKKMLNIINSMTLKEKKYPNIINHSRKRRISKGSGCSLQDINKLIKYYEKFTKFLNKEASNKSISKKIKF